MFGIKQMTLFTQRVKYLIKKSSARFTPPLVCQKDARRRLVLCVGIVQKLNTNGINRKMTPTLNLQSIRIMHNKSPIVNSFFIKQS